MWMMLPAASYLYGPTVIVPSGTMSVAMILRDEEGCGAPFVAGASVGGPSANTGVTHAETTTVKRTQYFFIAKCSWIACVPFDIDSFSLMAGARHVNIERHYWG